MANTKIRVAIPLRNLTPAGVSRFILNLINNLGKLEGCEVFVFHNDRSLEARITNCHFVFLEGKNRIIWDYIRFFFEAKKHRLDAILYPNNIIPPHHRWLDSMIINVVHDLAYFSKDLHEYKTLDTLYMRLFMAASCRLADHTIADSQSTKNEMIRILNVDPNKISVIHLGIEDRFRKQTDAAKVARLANQQGIKTPFLFYCGSLSPRKNMLRVLMAFDQIKDIIPHCLYLSTGISWHDAEVKRFIATKLHDRVRHLGNLSDDDLITMYSTADLFLYPSLNEGFGFPIIEAQACGCPVLTSNTTSCPEVAGKGAHLVDPYSVIAIQQGILKIVTDRLYRDQLVQAGHENKARFQWDKTARAYANLMFEGTTRSAGRILNPSSPLNR